MRCSVGLLLTLTLQLNAQWKPHSWPIIKHYDSQALKQIALPLGGIGTGTVSLGGRGELRDWEIMNVPAKGFSTVTTGNNAPFFAVYVKEKDKKPQSKALLGSLYGDEYLHYEGRPVDHHGLPRFEKASFDAAYPFGQVNLEDKNLPINVKIKGFNPLIPADADNSGLPIAILTYEVLNTSDNPLEVAVCGSIRNFIGKDGQQNTTDWKGDKIPKGEKKNRNTFKVSDNFRGIYFDSQGVDSTSAAWGTMALTTQESIDVTYRTASKKDSWSNSLLSFWDDFSADGLLTEKYKQDEDDPMASLSVKKAIAPHSSASFSFFITWNFPNRYAWSEKNLSGNYYSHQFSNAWNVAEKVLPRLSQLESQTLDFVNAISQSSYPDVVKEAALFNLTVLRSQTVFRLPSGHLMGWEGVMDSKGSCKGNCTHVWNYEVATPFLFGELAKTMRDVEFNYATLPDGMMNFRAELPLKDAAKAKTVSNGASAAADGQMGCIMKFYREWQLCGDETYLKNNWEQIKKVIGYAWVEKGWDANQDGVMEGSQHNTMDVNYYGPNPQMGFWYMGALRATEEMAIAMKDKAFAQKCRTLFTKGSQWMDANLFNGSYYEQKITDPKTFEYLDMKNPATIIPDYQLGTGCLVDQLVGQYMAHICGLGYLGDKTHIQTTSKNVMTNNFMPDLSAHFCNMRSYAMGNEAGLLMASWPKGRSEVPFPYFPEVMTGFEYAAAVEMIYEGEKEDALKCIQAIRDRHNGAKRNPFSEPECGHHYARSMASWATIIALSEFSYSGVKHSMTITSNPGTYFWSNGYAWGTCTVNKDNVVVKVLKGSLILNEFTLKNNPKPTKLKLNIKEGEEKTIKITL
ncbi:MAG: GH116 family glycosyl-hydrolase [Bacteroidales bacterium]